MTKKLKVAFINQPLDHVLPPHQNSIGIWTYQVARRITDSFDVTCYAKLMQGETEKVEYDGAVRYQFMRMAPIRAWDQFSSLFGRFYTTRKPLFAAGFYFLDFILPIAVDIRRKRFDVVHIHNFTQFVPVVRALNPKIKIVLHMNGEWLSQLDEKLMKARIDKADLVLGSSDHIRDLIRSRFPEFTKKVQTVYNGVDTEHFVPQESCTTQHMASGDLAGKPNADTFTAVPTEPNLLPISTALPTDAVAQLGMFDSAFEDEEAITKNLTSEHEAALLFVGRISPEKGIHVLIDAFAIVRAQYPNVTLFIVGPEGEIAFEYLVGLSNDPQVAGLAEFYNGSYAAHLRARIPSHLQKRIVFTGPIAQKHLIDQYHKADILVNPSFSESFGMSLAEAMACGKPVVASRVGGMKYIVEEGKTGYLVDQGDPEALADALLELLNRPKKRLEMGEAGRKRSVALFSWDQVSQDWAALVGELYEDNHL